MERLQTVDGRHSTVNENISIILERNCSVSNEHLSRCTLQAVLSASIGVMELASVR